MTPAGQRTKANRMTTLQRVRIGWLSTFVCMRRQQTHARAHTPMHQFSRCAFCRGDREDGQRQVCSYGSSLVVKRSSMVERTARSAGPQPWVMEADHPYSPHGCCPRAVLDLPPSRQFGTWQSLSECALVCGWLSDGPQLGPCVRGLLNCIGHRPP